MLEGSGMFKFENAIFGTEIEYFKKIFYIFTYLITYLTYYLPTFSVDYTHTQNSDKIVQKINLLSHSISIKLFSLNNTIGATGVTA